MANGRSLQTAIAAGLLLNACSGAPPRRNAADGDLSALADRYFEEVFFKYGPTRGTRAGLHQYDTLLEDYSRTTIDAQVAALKDFERRFDALSVAPGSPEAADRELLLSDVRSALLELTTIRGWEKDPDLYSSSITASAFVIMSRDFAPPAERLRSLVAREKQMPGVLDIARQNLKNPPRSRTPRTRPPSASSRRRTSRSSLRCAPTSTSCRTTCWPGPTGTTGSAPRPTAGSCWSTRSEEHTSEIQSQIQLVR